MSLAGNTAQDPDIAVGAKITFLWSTLCANLSFTTRF